jgi:replicative DNA helicase
MIETQGGDLIASVLDSESSLDDFVNLGLVPQIFVGDEREAFVFIRDFVRNHGEVPSRETLKEKGWTFPEVPEKPSYYLETLEGRFLHQSMKRAMHEAAEKLKGKDRAAAFEQLSKFVAGHQRYKYRHQLIDFGKQGAGVIKDIYAQKVLHGSDFGVPTSWPKLDKMLNGALPGDLIIVVGKTKAGKTYLLLWTAHQAWLRHKKRVMFVSLEMGAAPLLTRLAAIHAKIPVTALNHAELTTQAKKKLYKELAKANNDVPFLVVDGNLTASVDDIVLLARQYKPDVVYVDGAYMLQPGDKFAKGYHAIVDTARGMKRDLASALGIPVYATYQFNKEALKVKKGQEFGIQMVAGSQEIPWLATVLLGITEDDTVENQDRKKIEIMLGRNGESGDFWVNWIFDSFPYMDFSQIKEKSVGDLQYT